MYDNRLLDICDNLPSTCTCAYVSWLSLLFWAQCTHTQLNLFYHPFHPDVYIAQLGILSRTYKGGYKDKEEEKDTRPSFCFSILQATETWARPGYEATLSIFYSFMILATHTHYQASQNSLTSECLTESCLQCKNGAPSC